MLLLCSKHKLSSKLYVCQNCRNILSNFCQIHFLKINIFDVYCQHTRNLLRDHCPLRDDRTTENHVEQHQHIVHMKMVNFCTTFLFLQPVSWSFIVKVPPEIDLTSNGQQDCWNEKTTFDHEMKTSKRIHLVVIFEL